MTGPHHPYLDRYGDRANRCEAMCQPGSHGNVSSSPDGRCIARAATERDGHRCCNRHAKMADRGSEVRWCDGD